jgi:hypothetical protein
MLKRVVCSLLAAICLNAISFAQAASQPQSGEPSNQHPPMLFSSGTVIRAQLDKTIDAKKAKVGDPVSATTIDDLKSTPAGLATKGCKILGHIAEVAPHQGDSVSTLGIVFDKLVLKDGSDMALPAKIQAIGFPDTTVSVNNDQTITKMGGNVGTSQPSSSIGSGGGQPSGYGGERMPSGMPTNSDAKLPFTAQGALGMSGVELSTGTAQDSLLSAKKHNVKIESGMQMILRTQ